MALDERKRMRKLILAAAIAACFALPGRVDAELPCLYACEMAQQQQVDPELLGDILRAAANASCYSYECLSDGYAAGQVEVVKVGETWRVSMVDGGWEIVLEDMF